MKVIIPAAGVGQRLRPHTYSIPKSLLMVAGKPIIGHILEKLNGIEFDEIILIVGYMKDKIKRYVNQNYNFNIRYVEQKERLGLGHAIWLTKDIVKNEPALIVYGDTIFFKEDFKKAVDLSADRQDMGVDGCLGVRSVKDPTQFGIVEVEHGFIKHIIEKPTQPTTNLADVGVNFIRNTQLLFDCLKEIITNDVKTMGEFQLTDAFQLMVKRGAKLKPFRVKGWFDCGRLEGVLSTNRKLLKLECNKNIKIKEPVSPSQCGSVIIPPVFIHPLAKITHSIIGPYVSIDKGSTIKNSIILDSIVNFNARIENLLLRHSIIGPNTAILGRPKRLGISGRTQ
ncbi:MAG: sugar phosphate nucleotidyltransferase [bacterium]|nr:sugar phosphate nucleotidyltransferase [bacterium]